MYFTYTYLISDDFSSIYKPLIFIKEIKNSSLSGKFKSIRNIGNICHIYFNDTLTSGEEDILDELVSNHSPDIKNRTKFFSVYPDIKKSKNSTYTTMSTFKYGGSSYIGEIDYIDIISKKQSSVTDYDIRIYDIFNNNVIAEKTGLTNDSYEIINLGNLSNISTESTILEIQVRANGGQGGSKFVFLQEAIIYHGNI